VHPNVVQHAYPGNRKTVPPVQEQETMLQKGKRTAAQINYQNKKFLTQVGFEPTPEDQYLKLAP
jgi:hypothetical protein